MEVPLPPAGALALRRSLPGRLRLESSEAPAEAHVSPVVQAAPAPPQAPPEV